jgi:hypothetical protein
MRAMNEYWFEVVFLYTLSFFFFDKLYLVLILLSSFLNTFVFTFASKSTPMLFCFTVISMYVSMNVKQESPIPSEIFDYVA